MQGEAFILDCHISNRGRCQSAACDTLRIVGDTLKMLDDTFKMIGDTLKRLDDALKMLGTCVLKGS